MYVVAAERPVARRSPTPRSSSDPPRASSSSRRQRLVDERRIVGAVPAQERALLGRRQVGRRVKQRLESLPARRRPSVIASSCASHALAARQSRNTVDSEISSSSAVSATSSPPKNRLSTSVACRGSILARSCERLIEREHRVGAGGGFVERLVERDERAAAAALVRRAAGAPPPRAPGASRERRCA